MFPIGVFVPPGVICPAATLMINLEYPSGAPYGQVPKSACSPDGETSLIERLRKLMNDPNLVFISRYGDTMIITRHSIVNDCIKAMQKGKKMKRMPPWVWSRWEFVEWTLKHRPDGRSLQYASKKIRNNPEYMRHALKVTSGAAQYIGPELINDLKFVKSIVAKHQSVYKYLPYSYQCMPEIIKAVMVAFPGTVNHFKVVTQGVPQLINYARECRMVQYKINKLCGYISHIADFLRECREEERERRERERYRYQQSLRDGN